MLCTCHGEECYWQRDRRLKAGGWWECSVNRRQRERDRYDRDPIHRIGKQLADDRRRRASLMKRRREALSGEISPEGRR